MRNAILELTKLQKNIIKDKEALSEVYYLCQNTYYIDNYAGLHNILNPFESKVYEKANVLKEYIGKYKKAFSNELKNNHNNTLI